MEVGLRKSLLSIVVKSLIVTEIMSNMFGANIVSANETNKEEVITIVPKNVKIINGKAIDPVNILEESKLEGKVVSEKVNDLTINDKGELIGKPYIEFSEDKEEELVSIPIKIINNENTTEGIVELTILRDTDGDGIEDKKDNDDDGDNIVDNKDKEPKIFNAPETTTKITTVAPTTIVKTTKAPTTVAKTSSHPTSTIKSFETSKQIQNTSQSPTKTSNNIKNTGSADISPAKKIETTVEKNNSINTELQGSGLHIQPISSETSTTSLENRPIVDRNLEPYAQPDFLAESSSESSSDLFESEIGTEDTSTRYDDTSEITTRVTSLPKTNVGEEKSNKILILISGIIVSIIILSIGAAYYIKKRND